MKKLVATGLVALAGFTACGGSDEPDTPSTGSGGPPAVEKPAESAKPRAARLLDDWSGTLLAALVAARERGSGAETGDRAAYEDADAELRPRLREVKRFAPQGRVVMSQYPDGELRRAVVADGDAWQEWAIRILGDRSVTLDEARKVADLGATAFAAHERAYELAGRKPPPALQRRPDQQ